MKIGKGSPSRIVVEIIKATGEEIRAPIAHLAKQIILSGVIQIIDLNFYKGKGIFFLKKAFGGVPRRVLW